MGAVAKLDPLRRSIWIVLPVNTLAKGKSRLLLEGAARVAINRAFYTHVLGVACMTVALDHIVVVSRDEAVFGIARRAGVRVLREAAGADLNDALTAGMRFARARGATGILSLFTDLPFLHHRDLMAMMEAFDGSNLVIAPDEGGTGSNALLMAPGAFSYRHGKDSFWRHLDAAREAVCSFEVIRTCGLMRDVDVPSQYALLPEDVRAHADH